VGVCLLLLATFAGVLMSKDRRPSSLPPVGRFYRAAILAAVWFSIVPFMSVSGAATPTRSLTPQVTAMMAVFLLDQTGDWILRRPWWRRAGFLVFLLAAVLLILSPARPLWPAGTVLSSLSATNPLVKRAQTVYAVYSERADAFAPARAILHDDPAPLGLITFDDPETSLWRPFGHRRILHVKARDTAADMCRRGIHYVLVNPPVLAERSGLTLAQWTETNRMQVVLTIPLTLKASIGPVDWVLVKVPPVADISDR
jgi:hypothetical protein